jgi:hypothetical protein
MPPPAAELPGYRVLHTNLVDAPTAELVMDYSKATETADAFRLRPAEIQAARAEGMGQAYLEAVFAVRYLGLLITGLLRRAVPGLGAVQLRRLLCSLTVAEATRGVYLVSRHAGWDELDHAFGLDTDHKWATIQDLRRWRRDMARGVGQALRQGLDAGGAHP